MKGSDVLEITRDTFAAEVLESEQPVLIDFWGPQCGPCLKLNPIVQQLAEEFAGRVKIVKVEAPKNRRLCMQLRVMALPTFLSYVGGEEVARLTGEVSREQVQAAVRDLAERVGPAPAR